MKRPRLAAELPAGLAAVSLRLHGGRHCRPPISRQGAKTGYAASILAALGLRSGQGADAYVWAEADPDVRALLRAYPDADMLRRIADIIRGWKDEEPRALWERLRAERKARGPAVEPDVAGWIVSTAWTPHPDRYIGPDFTSFTAVGIDGLTDRCHRLAEYASIAPVGEVAGAFERVAEWTWLQPRTHPGDGGFLPADHVMRTGSRQGDTFHRWLPDSPAKEIGAIASRWPPVVVLPRIPAAEDVAKWLGTPGDLEGCVCYMDPPYLGTTGYAANLTRAEVVSIAIEYAAMGATVAVSEAVALPELLALGWHATEITAGRVGKARTFSKQKQEFLTMNREPAHRIATQPGLFGVAP